MKKPRTVEVGVHEAKTHLSKLLARVTAGEEVVITRGGKPVARVVRFERPPADRLLGQDRDLVSVAADFDAPLPDDLMRGFEG